MLIKARFRCEKCAETIDIEGAVNQYGAFLEAIQREGWKVVADRLDVRHYCPACEVDKF